MQINEILNAPVLEGEHISELEELLFDGYGYVHYETWEQVEKDGFIHVYTVKHEKYDQYGERNLKVGYLTFHNQPVLVWVLAGRGKDGGELFPVNGELFYLLKGYFAAITDNTHIYDQDFNIESVNGYGLV